MAETGDDKSNTKLGFLVSHHTLNLAKKPLLLIPIIEGEVYARLTHLSELKGTPYHYYIDIHEPISDS